MKKAFFCLILTVFASGAGALEPVADEFWDTTRYSTVPPNANAAELPVIDTESMTRGFAVSRFFDREAWTLHRSRALEVFRSIPPGGMFLIIR